MFLLGLLTSIIPLAILLAIVGMSVRAIWLATMPPRRCVKEASCERCKYPVAGLGSWTCPECGSHLLTVGIVTRAMEVRRRGSYVGAISGLFTILFVCVVVGLIVTEAMIGGAFGLGMGSMPTTTNVTMTTPSSERYASLKIEQIDDYSGMTGPYTGVLHLDVAGQVHEMHIDVFNSLTFSTFGPQGTSPSSGTVDAASLSAWFESVGVDVSGDVAAREIAELDAMIQAWPANWTPPSAKSLPSHYVAITTTTTSTPSVPLGPPSAYEAIMWAIPITGVTLFIVFTVLIIRRRRKLLREAESQVPGTVPASAARSEP